MAQIESIYPFHNSVEPFVLKWPRSGRHSFGHNSPAARELFKPFTDATSLVVKIEKKIFCFGFELFSGKRHK